MDPDQAMDTLCLISLPLSKEERLALIDVLLAVEDEWSLRPAERTLLTRLEARGSAGAGSRVHSIFTTA